PPTISLGKGLRDDARSRAFPARQHQLLVVEDTAQTKTIGAQISGQSAGGGPRRIEERVAVDQPAAPLRQPIEAPAEVAASKIEPLLRDDAAILDVPLNEILAPA